MSAPSYTVIRYEIPQRFMPLKGANAAVCIGCIVLTLSCETESVSAREPTRDAETVSGALEAGWVSSGVDGGGSSLDATVPVHAEREDASHLVDPHVPDAEPSSDASTQIGDGGAPREAGVNPRDAEKPDAKSNNGSPGDDGCEGFALPYTRDLRAQGANGMWVTLTAADPEPPEVGRNEWSLFVEDRDGQALEAAELNFKPFMPQHGHGSPTIAHVSELGDGRYRIQNIDFIMPGYWRNTITINHETGDDVVELKVCID